MGQPFRGLKVWQRSKALAATIYRITGARPISRDVGLCDQMRRAAVSICSNIAEGDSRQGIKEMIHFFYIAKGSLAELTVQLELAGEIYFLDIKEMKSLLSECDEISAMIQALINHRRT